MTMPVDLLLADGEAAGQSVFHVHLHVVPRFVGDGFGLKFSPNYFFLPPRAEPDDIAGGIRNAVQRYRASRRASLREMSASKPLMT